MQSREKHYGQNRRSRWGVKRCSFTLPGESKPRTCFSLNEMMETIKKYCPHGKMRELLDA